MIHIFLLTLTVCAAITCFNLIPLILAGLWIIRRWILGAVALCVIGAIWHINQSHEENMRYMAQEAKWEESHPTPAPAPTPTPFNEDKFYEDFRVKTQRLYDESQKELMTRLNGTK